MADPNKADKVNQQNGFLTGGMVQETVSEVTVEQLERQNLTSVGMVGMAERQGHRQ